MRATEKLPRLAMALALPLGVMLGASEAAGQAAPDVLTGCLSSNGNLSNLQHGDSPSKSCKGNSVEVQISLGGGSSDSGGGGEPSMVQPFFVTLDQGTEATIATNGPLEYFARCGQNAFNDIIEIYATSTADGWRTEDATTAQLANTDISVMAAFASTGTSDYNNDTSESSIIAADGSYMAIEGDTVGLGLNILGHDCVVVGGVYSIPAPQ